MLWKSLIFIIFSIPVLAQQGKLVWNDEFDGANGVPDPELWTYEFGDGCPNICGWGNNEIQYYTSAPKNAHVENGLLILEAHKEMMGGLQYTSAKLNSKKTGSWKYGRIDVRARIPQGLGTCPAIWMLPTEWKYGGWPMSGEIDIMEHVGWNKDTLYGTVHTDSYNHTKGTQKGRKFYQHEMGLRFHVYSIIWNTEKIDFLLDDKIYYSYANDGTGPASWPFDQSFYLIMNISVGGNFGGAKGVEEENIWPQRMEIDYVRVYQ